MPQSVIMTTPEEGLINSRLLKLHAVASEQLQSFLQTNRHDEEEAIPFRRVVIILGGQDVQDSFSALWNELLRESRDDGGSIAIPRFAMRNGINFSEESELSSLHWASRPRLIFVVDTRIA